MVEGPTAVPSGGLISFPGIIPAAINEASEIMHQLNKRCVWATNYEYDSHDNLIRESGYEVTPLQVIMLFLGPAAAVAVLRILEMASQYRVGVPGGGPPDVVGAAASVGLFGAAGLAASQAAKAASVVDQAIEAAKKTGGGLGTVLKNIWNVAQSVKVPFF